MAYTALSTKSDGDTITTSDWSAIKGNFEAGVPDIFTAAGDIAYATGNDAAARLALGTADDVLVSGSISPEWQPVHCCRIYNASSLELTAPCAWESITFDSERFDTGMHTLSGSTQRITIPSGGDGIYIIGATVRFDSSVLESGQQDLAVRIYLNGATVIGQDFQVVRTGTSSDVERSTAVPYSLAATDYIECQAYTTACTAIVAAGNIAPIFWAVWQRRP